MSTTTLCVRADEKLAGIPKSTELVILDLSKETAPNKVDLLIAALSVARSVHSLHLITKSRFYSPSVAQWRAIGECITNLKWQHEAHETGFLVDLRAFADSLASTPLIVGDPDSAKRHGWPLLSLLEFAIDERAFDDNEDTAYLTSCLARRKRPLDYLVTGSLPISSSTPVTICGTGFANGSSFAEVVTTPGPIALVPIPLPLKPTQPPSPSGSVFVKDALAESRKHHINSYGVPVFEIGGIPLFRYDDEPALQRFMAHLKEDDKRIACATAIRCIRPQWVRSDVDSGKHACKTITIPSKTLIGEAESEQCVPVQPSLTAPACFETEAGNDVRPEYDRTLFVRSFRANDHAEWWRYSLERRAYATLGLDGSITPKFDGLHSYYSRTDGIAYLVTERVERDYTPISNLRELPLTSTAREKIALGIAVSLTALHRKGWVHNSIDAESILYNCAANHAIFVNLRRALTENELMQHVFARSTHNEFLYDVAATVAALKPLDVVQIPSPDDPSSLWRLFLSAYRRLTWEQCRESVMNVVADITDQTLAKRRQIIDAFTRVYYPRMSHGLPATTTTTTASRRYARTDFSSSVREVFAHNAFFLRMTDDDGSSFLLLRPLSAPPAKASIQVLPRLFEPNLFDFIVGLQRVDVTAATATAATAAYRFESKGIGRRLLRLFADDSTDGAMVATLRALLHLSGVTGIEVFKSAEIVVDHTKGTETVVVHTETPAGTPLAKVFARLCLYPAYESFLCESLRRVLRSAHLRGISHGPIRFDDVYLDGSTHLLTLTNWSRSTCRSECERLLLPQDEKKNALIVCGEQADYYALAVAFHEAGMKVSARKMSVCALVERLVVKGFTKEQILGDATEYFVNNGKPEKLNPTIVAELKKHKVVTALDDYKAALSEWERRLNDARIKDDQEYIKSV